MNKSSNQGKVSVGRPTEFNRNEVLTKAMNVFWDYGFTKTTYAKLEEITGVKRQSLVYAFGDKQAMLREVLNHYAATEVQAVIDQLEAPGSPLENIVAAFSIWLEHAHRSSSPGCLFVNTVAEMGVADPEIKKITGMATQKLIKAFDQAFQSAKKQDKIISNIETLALAKQAVALGDGALLHCRTTGDPSLVEAAFESFISLISP